MSEKDEPHIYERREELSPALIADTGWLRAFRILVEQKNCVRRKQSNISELAKNNGFPTMPLEEMIARAQEEITSKGNFTSPMPSEYILPRVDRILTPHHDITPIPRAQIEQTPKLKKTIGERVLSLLHFWEK